MKSGGRWSGLLWDLLAPQRRERIAPTLSGVLLIVLSLGIGMAAYNAANNILFITLSLLLACLVLSGVLSWFNFRKVTWQLDATPPFRAGQEAVIGVELRNYKRVLPTYGLWLEMVARPIDRSTPRKAESTVTARGIDVRAMLAKAAQVEARGQLPLRARIDPGTSTRLEWTFQPSRRGVLRIELEAVGSLFPFGFLKKQRWAGVAAEVKVWPQPIDYLRVPGTAVSRLHGGERVARVGAGSDLLALRRYDLGDSHRLIHWKASARTGQLLVRQFAAESAGLFSVWVSAAAEPWADDEQFETMLRLAVSLAEDLLRADRLRAVAIDGGAWRAIRRVRDLDTWLDELALLAPRKETLPVKPAGGGRNLIVFAPQGARGVAAVCDGEIVATT